MNRIKKKMILSISTLLLTTFTGCGESETSTSGGTNNSGNSVTLDTQNVDSNFSIKASFPNSANLIDNSTLKPFTASSGKYYVSQYVIRDSNNTIIHKNSDFSKGTASSECIKVLSTGTYIEYSCQKFNTVFSSVQIKENIKLYDNTSYKLYLEETSAETYNNSNFSDSDNDFDKQTFIGTVK